jgi:glycosyltransferase involved in cell wall biosynthesis
MSPAVSVIICTHAPRGEVLARTIDGLRCQTLPVEAWELIVVDNSSPDPVVEAVVAWHPRGRIVREPALGLTHARLCGISSGRAGLLLFVDDDNVLAPDYLEQAVAIHRRLPMLGCFGAAVIEPEYEEEPAVQLRPFMSMLALRSAAVSRWSNDPHDPFTPWGAGLAVTRQVAEAVAAATGAQPLKGSLDRKGDSLSSCGDDEFSWVACESGWGRGVFTELRLTHLIPRGRVQKDYLLRLAEGLAFSRIVLWHLHGHEGHVVRPLAPPGRLAALALSGQTRRLGSEMLEYGRVLAQSRVQREFRRAKRRGEERARAFLAAGAAASADRGAGRS